MTDTTRTNLNFREVDRGKEFIVRWHASTLARSFWALHELALGDTDGVDAGGDDRQQAFVDLASKFAFAAGLGYSARAEFLAVALEEYRRAAKGGA
jgi:hypothetical protein